MVDHEFDRRIVLAAGRNVLDTRTTSLTRDVVLSVNGTDHALRVDTRMTLLDALRERLGLAGSKKGCDQGQCGACTVHVGGERHLACLTLAVAAQARPITTVEGLADGDRLHPMQQAFIDYDAFQCGYCTPGQIMSAIACVHEGHATSARDIREYMSGNLCRCAAYPNIAAAVAQARTEMAKGGCALSPTRRRATPPRLWRSPPPPGARKSTRPCNSRAAARR